MSKKESRSAGSSTLTVAIIGKAGVGKTTFINALATGLNEQADRFTAEGVDIRERVLRVGHRQVMLTFWDTAGTLTEGCLSKLKEVDGFILIYSVFNWDSFSDLVDSVDVIRSHLGNKPNLVVGNKYKPTVVDGNKPVGQPVRKKYGEELARSLGAHFFEIDALDSKQAQGVMQNWDLLKQDRSKELQIAGGVLVYQAPQQGSHKETEYGSKGSSIKASVPDVVNQRHFKVILVGNSRVGKTSFIMQLIEGKFHQVEKTTKHIDLVMHGLDVEGQPVKLQIWDTAAQERFQFLPDQYYRRAEGAIVMYDITDRRSYQDASRWAQDVKKKSEKEPVLVVVGNKRDLAAQRAVTVPEGKMLAYNLSSRTSMASFYETSAMTGEHVQSAVKNLAEQMLRDEDAEADDVTRLHDAAAGQQQKRKCCK